jgi:ribonuclease HIII
MSADADLAWRLKEYWLSPDRPAEAADQIVIAALTEPPQSLAVAARALQLMDEVGGALSEAWQVRMADFRRYVAELTAWAHRVDELGDPDTAAVKVLEYAGGDEEQLNLPAFDAQALHSSRVGAASVAAGAAALLDAFGREHLESASRLALERATADLLDRGKHYQGEALFVEEQGTRGFVLGVQVVPNDSGVVEALVEVGADMKAQAALALSTALPDRGAKWKIEWPLPFDGASIGLALYLAAQVATGQRKVDPLLAASGEIDLNGDVRGVAGIEAKLRAAERSGMRRVLLSEENRADAEAAGELAVELIFVERVGEIAAKLAQVGTHSELQYDDRVRYMRKLLPVYRLAITDERAVKDGHRFDVGDRQGRAVVIVYTGVKASIVAQGANGSARAAVEQLIADNFPAPKVEKRPPRSFFVPTPNHLKTLRELVQDAGGSEEAVNKHEDARLLLQRGPTKALVVVYSSGRAVLQAGQAPAYDELDAIVDRALQGLGGGEETSVVTARAAASKEAEASAAARLDEPHIGTDESGKGDFFGPLVSAAVFIDARTKRELDALGVVDSKKLSDGRIRKLATEIRRVADGRYAVTRINPDRFNTLSTQMKSEGKNLNTLLAWGHARSIEDLLLKGVKAPFAVIDQFGDVSYIENKILADTRQSGIEILQYPKAESDTAVAAASILARESFIDWLDRESVKLGIKLPRGASDLVIAAGRDIVARYGADKLSSVAKLSFKTTAKVLA